MWSATALAQIGQGSASNPCFLFQRGERELLECRPGLRFPLVTSRILILRVKIPFRVDQSCLNVFEAVGFVADVFDLFDADMPTLE